MRDARLLLLVQHLLDEPTLCHGCDELFERQPPDHRGRERQFSACFPYSRDTSRMEGVTERARNGCRPLFRLRYFAQLRPRQPLASTRFELRLFLAWVDRTRRGLCKPDPTAGRAEIPPSKMRGS
jgi:hypothetical protein